MAFAGNHIYSVYYNNANSPKSHIENRYFNQQGVLWRERKAVIVFSGHAKVVFVNNPVHAF